MHKEVIGDCELWLGDAKNILQTIRADVVVTDPPYGVMLGEVKNGQSIRKQQIKYKSFSDTPEYIHKNIVPIISNCIESIGRVIVTTGNRNMWAYPQPDDFGVWYNPAGTSRGKWGFSLVVTPILYYGKDPRAGQGSWPSSVWGHCDPVGEIKNTSHPCPKPLKFTKWLVDKSSLSGEKVFDPFMGSGTTAVACIATGRSFVGCEIEKEYFDLSCKRITEAYKQPDFFVQQPTKIKQESFL